MFPAMYCGMYKVFQWYQRRAQLILCCRHDAPGLLIVVPAFRKARADAEGAGQAVATDVPVWTLLGHTACLARSRCELVPRVDKSSRLYGVPAVCCCYADILGSPADDFLLHGARSQRRCQVEGAVIAQGRRLQYARRKHISTLGAETCREPGFAAMGGASRDEGYCAALGADQ